MLLTSFGRVRRLTERAAQRLPKPAEVLELDVNSEEDLDGLTESPPRALGGSTERCTRSQSLPRTRSGGTS